MRDHEHVIHAKAEQQERQHLHSGGVELDTHKLGEPKCARHGDDDQHHTHDTYNGATLHEALGYLGVTGDQRDGGVPKQERVTNHDEDGAAFCGGLDHLVQAVARKHVGAHDVLRVASAGLSRPRSRTADRTAWRRRARQM